MSFDIIRAGRDFSFRVFLSTSAARSVAVAAGKLRNTHPMTTMVKSSKFHELRK